jgi:hypothetical protein
MLSILLDEVESLFDFATSIRSGHEPWNKKIYNMFAARAK